MLSVIDDGTDYRNAAVIRTSIKMNKIQRRTPRVDHSTKKNPMQGYRPGIWTSCFNMFISPSVETYWAECLRYMCSVEKRSQFKTSHKIHASSSNYFNGGPSSVAVVPPPHTRFPMTVVSPIRTSNKPHAVLSFITWDDHYRDLRGLLAQALQANTHFTEGFVLNTIETDASEEMGEPLLWYPVAHILGGVRLPMYPSEGIQQDKKALGTNFTLLQDYYYEHAKLTLIVDHGERGRISPLLDKKHHESKVKNQLVLGYKSLEDSTDPQLLVGWVRWSGAWVAYTYLQEKKLPVSSISLYVREKEHVVRRRQPKETFKYVVMLEVITYDSDQLQQLRAATQRLRVERWSGYICLYTVHTLQDFADNFNSSDSISKFVGDIV
ncbi:uncharacterized protein LOC135224307 [Macrobrachium nipponense]|uniref:uncharacterized protein LOC135224307 n=1 Tax=Macrobrachium nipponense TaxID=159736 RepID=UPI0030C7F365